MRVAWHIWSGVGRAPAPMSPWLCPTVVVDVNLMDWALPLSLHIGGPLLGKPGVTLRVGPLNIGWSQL